MSLGAWIFLSAIFLGSVALFIATREQRHWKKIITWPWRKIVNRAAVVIICLVVLAGIVLFGRYIYLKIAERPKVQKSFWGLTLDSTKEDIKFLKGKPTEEEQNRWFYIVKDGYLRNIYMIDFVGNKIQKIVTSENVPICGIKIGSTYEDVIKQFGEPSYISYSKNGLTRIASFKKYKVCFALEKGKVLNLGIYNPNFGDIRCKDEAPASKRNPYLDLLNQEKKDGMSDRLDRIIRERD